MPQTVAARRLKPFPITPKEYKEFRDLQDDEKRRPEWWAIFSVNPQEQVWPFVTFKRTPEDKREYVQLENYPLLRQVAQFFVSQFEEAGRFFISQEGVFGKKGEFHDSKTIPEQFIRWVPDEPLPELSREVANSGEASKPQPIAMTLQELLKRQRSCIR